MSTDDGPLLQIGQIVSFGGLESVVTDLREQSGTRVYLIENGASRVAIWVPELILVGHQSPGTSVGFRQTGPDVVVVDDFFDDPDQIRAIALAQEYARDPHFYKGLRSYQRPLWPWLREEFSRLLGRDVTGWSDHVANGVFQQTSHDDPLVWHNDPQQYAAAIYLTPDAPPGSGTSFWRDRSHGCRRSPDHPLELARLGGPDAVAAAFAAIYHEDNMVRPGNWELIESVAGLYNRLVIWDARLFHSATSYEGFTDGPGSTRLVQLFFFDAQ
jgi:hypothetical protein